MEGGQREVRARKVRSGKIHLGNIQRIYQSKSVTHRTHRTNTITNTTNDNLTLSLGGGLRPKGESAPNPRRVDHIGGRIPLMPLTPPKSVVTSKYAEERLARERSAREKSAQERWAMERSAPEEISSGKNGPEDLPGRDSLWRGQPKRS